MTDERAPAVKLYHVITESGECDAFVRHTDVDNVLISWRAFFKGKYDPEAEVTVVEVPVNTNIVGVIPDEVLDAWVVEP